MNHRSMRLRLALMSLALPLSLASLSGQEKPPLKLALRQAVEMALRENPQVQIAVLSFAESKENRTEARSGLLPQVSLRVGEAVQRENIDALFGKPFPGIPQHIGPFQNFQAGPVFSFPLLDLTAYRR